MRTTRTASTTRIRIELPINKIYIIRYYNRLKDNITNKIYRLNNNLIIFNDIVKKTLKFS